MVTNAGFAGAEAEVAFRGPCPDCQDQNETAGGTAAVHHYDQKELQP
jgi:hypothetical protein